MLGGAAVKRHHLWFALFPSWLCSAQLAADDGVFDQYRDLMGDDNPAVFVVDEGKELWFMPDDFEVPFVGKTEYPPIEFDEKHLRQVCWERFNNDYIKFGYEKDEVYKMWEKPLKNFKFR